MDFPKQYGIPAQMIGKKQSVKDGKINYLAMDMEVKGEDELSFSVASQAGMLSRRFYKKYGVEFNSLEILKTVCLVYIESHAFVSEITDEQMRLLKKISVSLEYK